MVVKRLVAWETHCPRHCYLEDLYQSEFAIYR